MIAALDRSVGKVVEKLKDLDIYGKTLIVFTSDNGGANYIELEDINNDGCLDLIYWGDGSGIAYGNCDGTFGNTQVLNSSNTAEELTFGSFGYFMDFDFTDFDNDGDIDFVINGMNDDNQWKKYIYEREGNDLFEMDYNNQWNSDQGVAGTVDFPRSILSLIHI